MKRCSTYFFLILLSISLSSCGYLDSGIDTSETSLDNLNYEIFLEVEENNVNINDIVELHFSSDEDLYANKISFNITNNSANVSIEEIFIDNYAHYYVSAEKDGQATIEFLYDDNYATNPDPVTLNFDYQTISTVEDFMAINNSEKAYKIVNNIDFSGIEFNSIDSFSGSINGQGYSLQNIYIEAKQDHNNAIFNTLTSEAEIRNINIENFYLDAFFEQVGISVLTKENYGTIQDIDFDGYIYAPFTNYVGGISAYNYGIISDINGYIELEAKAYIGGITAYNEGQIQSVIIRGQIDSNNIHYNGSDPVAYIGGIAGWSNQNINQATNYANISSNKSGLYVGGIIAYNIVTSDAIYSELENHGDISGESHVGGIFGHLNVSNNDFQNYTVNSLINHGIIYSRENYIGGIIGYHESANNKEAIATYIYNHGLITSDGSYVGGITGFSNASSTFQETTNYNDITGIQYVGGIIGYTETYNLSNLINEGSVQGSKLVGGIAGHGFNINNSINYGNVIGVNDIIEQYLGGIAGLAKGTLYENENHGNITSELSMNYIGGIAGLFNPSSEAEIYNLINDGNVSGGNFTGGIIGHYHSFNRLTRNTILIISNITNDGSIVGNDYVGGLFGKLSPIRKSNLGTYLTESFSMNNLTNNASVTGNDYVGGIAGAIKQITDQTYIVNEGLIHGNGENVNDLYGFNS